MPSRTGGNRVRSRRGWLWCLPALALLGLCALAVSPAYVVRTTQPYRYVDPAQIPPQRVALVLGAGVVNGAPTPALRERVAAAAGLYHRGTVQKLLFSGDNSRKDYDEVTAMKDYAVTLDVPAEDITLDYAGFSTYESCYRARDIFGVRRVIIVTQSYHLPRAVYTARRLGIDATGLGTPDWTWPEEHWTIHFNRYERVWYTLREGLAILKALVEVHVTHPLPTFLGPFEGIK